MNIEVTRLQSVAPQEVRWLWPGRIALGKITLLAGDPGLGKSFVTLDVATRVSRGKRWPDCDSHATKGSVLLLSAEDDIADTIRPRLDAAGADPRRVFAVTASVHIGNIGQLEAILDQIDDCRLLVVDPITAYLGSTDSHKNADVRAVLSPLAGLAARRGLAVLGVTHLNKGSGPAIYRATGSLAFVAAARAVFVVTKDDEDQDRRMLLPVKNNLAPDTMGIGFWLSGDPPTVKWDRTEIEIVADDVLSRADDMTASAMDDARQWLRYTLMPGPVPNKILTKLAKEVGHAWMTVRRAKDALGVKSRRRGIGSDAQWSWELPEQKGQ